MMAGWWHSTVAAIVVVSWCPGAEPFCTMVDTAVTTNSTRENSSFPQLLDHFSLLNNTTFGQTYLEKCNHFKDGGPVFLSIGGYSQISESWAQDSTLEWYAREHNALMFKIEHRFYGKSAPKNNAGDLSMDNLKYLTTSQALADLAYFIQAMNKDHPLLQGRHPRWIAFGCHYAGALATWLRVKYPHLVFAAVASSAPLLGAVDSPEFTNEIADLIEHQRKGCGTEFKLTVYNLAQGSLFDLCNITMVNTTMASRQKTSMLLAVVRRIAHITQVGTDITTFCDIMLDRTMDNPMTKFFSALTGLGFNITNECEENRSCVEDYRNESASRTPDKQCPLYRQFLYQQCTEFGHFEALEKTEECDSNFESELCSEVFDPNFSSDFITNAIERYNFEYGGLRIEAARVITVHGSLDPWRTLGLTSPNTEESPVFIIQGGTRCADQVHTSPGDQDSSLIAEVQRNISDILGKWMNDRPNSTIAEHSKNRHEMSIEGMTMPLWMYLCGAGLIVVTVIVVLFVIFKFKKSSSSLHL